MTSCKVFCASSQRSLVRTSLLRRRTRVHTVTEQYCLRCRHLCCGCSSSVDTAINDLRAALPCSALTRPCSRPRKSSSESLRLAHRRRQRLHRCRHERGFDPQPGSADPAAARRAGSLDGEPEQPDDPEALPVRVPHPPEKGASPCKGRGFFRLRRAYDVDQAINRLSIPSAGAGLGCRSQRLRHDCLQREPWACHMVRRLGLRPEGMTRRGSPRPPSPACAERTDLCCG